MAKEAPRQNNSKVRIFFAEIEGGDQMIADGIRNLGAALVRATQPQLPPRVVRALPATPSANGKPDDKSLFDAVEPVVEQDGEEEVLDDLEVEQPTSGTTDKKPPRNRKPPSYSFIPDLNLRPSDKAPLRTFFAEKKPTSQQDQMAVIVYYLTQVLGVSNVGANHIYQSLKEVEQKVPKNIIQIVRNTAERRGWIDVSDTNNLRVTTQGENYVEHDLPPKAAS
ncbi:MAG: hypothetical protein ACAI43_13040 [Phycisphaerae bacterium]|nr:hypothetical protein [Tepidisphaeraceae bacterium]